MTTATVDDRKRVRLSDAKPGQVFSVEPRPDGSFFLVPVVPIQPPQAKVRIEKRGRYSVGVLDRTIDQNALEQALADFP